MTDSDRISRLKAQIATVPHQPMKRDPGESRSEHVLRIVNAHNGLTSFEVTHICGGYGPHAELCLLLGAGKISAVKVPRPFRYFPAAP